MANINIGNNNNNANNMNMVMFTPMNGRLLRLMRRKKRSTLYPSDVLEDVCLQHGAGKSELAVIALEAVRIYIGLEQQQNGFDQNFDVCKIFEVKSEKLKLSTFSKTLFKKLVKGASVILNGNAPTCLTKS